MKRNYSRIEIDGAKCTGCAMCVAICPEDVLAVDRVDGKLRAVAPWAERCVGCGYCEVICAHDAVMLEVLRLGHAL